MIQTLRKGKRPRRTPPLRTAFGCVNSQSTGSQELEYLDISLNDPSAWNVCCRGQQLRQQSLRSPPLLVYNDMKYGVLQGVCRQVITRFFQYFLEHLLGNQERITASSSTDSGKAYFSLAFAYPHTLAIHMWTATLIFHFLGICHTNLCIRTHKNVPEMALKVTVSTQNKHGGHTITTTVSECNTWIYQKILHNVCTNRNLNVTFDNNNRCFSGPFIWKRVCVYFTYL